MIRGALLLLCFLSVFVHAAAPKPSVLYVQVIRGTDEQKAPGKNHREIGPKLSAKLSPVFKWKHYWETDLKKVDFDPAKVTKLALTGQRTLEIERLKSGELEVRLFRRSGLVTKTRQATHGRMAILGGEESTRESFFVVVRPDEPVHGKD